MSKVRVIIKDAETGAEHAVGVPLEVVEGVVKKFWAHVEALFESKTTHHNSKGELEAAQALRVAAGQVSNQAVPNAASIVHTPDPEDAAPAPVVGDTTSAPAAEATA